MADTGKHDHRQGLPARPLKRARQRHHVVGIAVNHQRVGRHDRHLLACRRRRHQRQPLRFVGVRQLHGRLGRHEAAERKPCQQQRQRLTGGIGSERLDHGQRIVDFAAAFVPGALRRANATVIETHTAPAELQAGARQGLHHFVVHRAAVLRVRMADHGETRRRGARQRRIDGAFDGSGRASDGRALSLRIHARRIQRPTCGGSNSRSTTRPFLRCESTISSMSSLSR